MAKRLKIPSGLADDYTLIGIACHLKDYRIALIINRSLHFCLKKGEDLVLHDTPESNRSFSMYHFYNGDDRRTYFMISNHHPENRLIPSEKGVDYFLIVNDRLPDSWKSSLLSKLQGAPHIMAAYALKPKARHLDMIFEEIELQSSY